MIRFSASLVVVGVGLLIAGGVTSKLLLIYIAIGVSALALLFLILGAILHRSELFGREPEGIAASQAGHDGYADELSAKPAAAPVAATAVTTSPGAAETARPASEDLSPAQQAFAGYEQFTRQAARQRPGPAREDQSSRPSRPQAKPFMDPEPTRMDWAADLREAEKQERERQPQRPVRPEVPAQATPDRARPDRGRPFVDPQPTRMDWAAGLREAEKHELNRQDRTSGPTSKPEPAPAEATRAERIQAPADATRAERVQKPADATRAEKIQTPRAEPVPAQATRAEKIMTVTPDNEAAAGQDQPAGTAAPEATATATVQEKSAPDQPEAKPDTAPAEETRGSAEAPADTKRPAAESDTDTDTDSPGTGQPSTGQPSTPSSSVPEVTDKAGDADRDTGDEGTDTDTDTDDVTVVPGVPRFHRSECILIRFMGDNDLQRMPVEQARKAGCTPCRACQPDGPDGDEDD